MCKSVRGAAYFGSSLHLAFSFVFLIWFIFDTVISEININLWKCEPPEQKFSEIDPLAHYLNLLFKLLYFTGLCVTGVYMFRGVEREKPQILKFAALGFIILQILGVILFSVFFSIQWNVEPEGNSLLPEPARLTSPGNEEVLGAPPPNTIQGTCNQTEVVTGNIPLDLDHIVPEIAEIQGESEMLGTVTPIISENVIAAPDINGTLTTTTTPIPALPEPELPVVILAATTATTTTSTTTPAPVVPAPPLPPSASKPNKSKLPHNQLVSLVFQMCLVIANGLGSVAYIVVIGLYMIKL